MKLFLVLCLAYTAYASVIPKQIPTRINAKDVENDAKLTTPELIAKYGYPSETHEVQTDDGYLLTLFRIPYGRNCPASKSKGPVLVQHGLLCSSDDWVELGPGWGLGFVLADACYDVWLGNSRGNHYSRKHIKLDPDKNAKFWKYSWHEMAEYDLPASIDYVLSKTGKESLLYAGHSQGTTQAFIFGSRKSEQYKSKVKAMFALAPIAFMGHSNSGVLQTMAHFQGIAGDLAALIGMNEFMPSDGFINTVGRVFCQNSHPGMEGLCSNILFLACGFDSEQLNKTVLPVIMGHTPAGVSTRQLLHYAQSLNSGHFRHYDHGVVDNLLHYGTIHAPEYELEKNEIPIILIYSENDWLAAIKDVEKLKSKLSGIAGELLVPLKAFNHLDYMWATDVVELLYNPLIEIMDTY